MLGRGISWLTLLLTGLFFVASLAALFGLGALGRRRLSTAALPAFLLLAALLLASVLFRIRLIILRIGLFLAGLVLRLLLGRQQPHLDHFTAGDVRLQFAGWVVSIVGGGRPEGDFIAGLQSQGAGVELELLHPLPQESLQGALFVDKVLGPAQGEMRFPSSRNRG